MSWAFYYTQIFVQPPKHTLCIVIPYGSVPGLPPNQTELYLLCRPGWKTSSVCSVAVDSAHCQRPRTPSPAEIDQVTHSCMLNVWKMGCIFTLEWTQKTIKQTHLQQLSICAVYSSFHSVGEQTHHTAVHCPVVRPPAKVLNTRSHPLRNNKEPERLIHIKVQGS